MNPLESLTVNYETLMNRFLLIKPTADYIAEAKESFRWLEMLLVLLKMYYAMFIKKVNFQNV